MLELIVPRAPQVAQQIHGFYDAIGWDVRDDTESEFDTLASPDVGASFVAPTIAYWQSKNPQRRAHFKTNRQPVPSEFARGLRLKAMAAKILLLSENILIVPSDDDVHAIFERGGDILRAHAANIPPHEHAGVQEFRFTDPFGFPLRVTSDPGYQVNVSSNPLP